MLPVFCSDSSSLRALAPTGFAAAASWRRSVTTGSAAFTAGVPRSAASPRDWSAGRPAVEHGPSARIIRVMSGAAAPRAVNPGVAWSVSAPSRAIVGVSCDRNVGRRSMSAASATRSVAVARATALEVSLAPLTSPRPAPGAAAAEIVEDDREPLADGLAHDVVDQVEVDRLGRVLDRQQVLALARAVLDLVQLRRRFGPGRAGLRELA